MSDAILSTGGVAGLIARIPSIPWFEHGGAALAAAETDHARAWLKGLGFDVPVEGVRNWRDASALIQRPDWNPGWWRAETMLTTRLNPTDDFLADLGTVTETSSSIESHALAALARAGIIDAALAKVASGAAAEACHHYALVLLAGAGEDHAFAHKFALFAAGRWPLGIVGGTGFVF